MLVPDIRIDTTKQDQTKSPLASIRKKYLKSTGDCSPSTYVHLSSSLPVHDPVYVQPSSLLPRNRSFLHSPRLLCTFFFRAQCALYLRKKMAHFVPTTQNATAVHVCFTSPPPIRSVRALRALLNAETKGTHVPVSLYLASPNARSPQLGSSPRKRSVGTHRVLGTLKPRCTYPSVPLPQIRSVDTLRSLSSLERQSTRSSISSSLQDVVGQNQQRMGSFFPHDVADLSLTERSLPSCHSEKSWLSSSFLAPARLLLPLPLLLCFRRPEVEERDLFCFRHSCLLSWSLRLGAVFPFS